jgi:hypothetical protein
MPEINSSTLTNYDESEHYIEAVRTLYRDGKGEYRGRRNEEQQLIAEVTIDEARLIVDGALAGILALGIGGPVEIKIDDEKPIRGNFSWSDYRNEFSRALVGFGVITNRLERDGFEVPSYADLPASARMQVASALFHDFNAHNALRFGVQTAGVRKTEFKTVYTDDGGVNRLAIQSDRDKAPSERAIDTYMQERGYTTGVAAHPSLKISTDEYVALRRQYPEVDKDAFDRDVSFFTNVREEYENRE